MSSHLEPPPLPWLNPGEPLPPSHRAWGADTPAPGLLAAGGDLSPTALVQAYRQGAFPWYSQGQPVLWWSPDPRMVMEVAKFNLRPSLKKRIKRFAHTPGCEIRFDSAFNRVIQACAHTPRQGQAGTWIVSDMQRAYRDLALLGVAHSIETWVDGELVGGLYGVGIGRMVYGESMFYWQTDASKIALAALVAFCRFHDLPVVDCQQATPHLASLGAQPLPRNAFLAVVNGLADQRGPSWCFKPDMWACLIPGGCN